MTWTSGPHYPLATRLALLFTSGYAIWCLAGIIRRRSTRPGFLAVVPVLVNLPFVWNGFVNLSRGMSLSGGGRGALSAGLAEALLSLWLGATVSAALAGIASIRGPRHGSARSSAVTVLVLAILGGATLWFARFVGDTRVFDASLTGQAAIGGVSAAIVVVVFLAIAARKRVQPSPIAVAATATILAVLTWQQIGIYRRIAMMGF